MTQKTTIRLDFEAVAKLWKAIGRLDNSLHPIKFYLENKVLKRKVKTSLNFCNSHLPYAVVIYNGLTRNLLVHQAIINQLRKLLLIPQLPGQ
jgi:hypothetical protein